MAIRKNKINHQLEQNTAYVWLIVVKIYYNMNNKVMNRNNLMKRDPFKEIREWERRFFNDPFFTPSSLLEKE